MLEYLFFVNVGAFGAILVSSTVEDETSAIYSIHTVSIWPFIHEIVLVLLTGYCTYIFPLRVGNYVLVRSNA